MNVSICMAAYNGEKYIAQQINSIMAQLNYDDELIIYDDGSSDATAEIISNFISDKRVRYVKGNFNTGVLGAFNNSLMACTKEIIILSDQDDVWLNGKVNYAKKALMDNGVSGCLHNSIIIDQNENTITEFYKEKLSAGHFNLFHLLISNSVIGCCFAFRRDVLKIALPIPQIVSMHDWWLASVAVTRGKISYSEDVFLKYRRHENNLSVAKRRGFGKILLSRIFNSVALFILIGRIMIR